MQCFHILWNWTGERFSAIMLSMCEYSEVSYRINGITPKLPKYRQGGVKSGIPMKQYP
jgi:hypothetical protein